MPVLENFPLSQVPAQNKTIVNSLWLKKSVGDTPEVIVLPPLPPLPVRTWYSLD